MKLQISFDMTDLEQALTIANDIHEYADILDIGSLLLFSHGITALHRFKEQFPHKAIAVDTKIVDRAKDATHLFSKAQSNWITVMAGTNTNVIHAACSAAHEHGTKVMLDLIDSKEFGQSALEAKNVGVDALLMHQPYDVDEPLVFLDKWELIRGNTDLPIFISTRIKRDNIEDIIHINPNGIVLGRTITEAANPKEEAEFFYNLINNR
ncbi:MAG: hypothetical protein ACD_64C00314G0003 [uncultured bacterium]|nr:MAG: hypothetical protein ACD_64C00314G0003 [uncultured bacterium]HLE76149.1 orotidine 5'-phosphate decarboxylase / HUMPS family protein [Candidatus Babeliales bacterium]